MQPVEVHVSRLPLTKTGAAGLKPFGYELFDNAPTTFSPVTDMPVPADYLVGPGDEFNVQLFGNQNRSLTLLVNRDATISFPELGPHPCRWHDLQCGAPDNRIACCAADDRGAGERFDG